MTLIRDRYWQVPRETLGLRSRDPSTALDVQRNLDEVWRQVAGLRELTGTNANAISGVLDASRQPDSPDDGGSGGGSGGSAPDPDTPNIVFVWTDPFPIQLASQDGLSGNAVIKTFGFIPNLRFRIVSFQLTITQTGGGISTGPIFLNVRPDPNRSGGDVLLTSPYNLSPANAGALVFQSGSQRSFDGAAIEGGGSSREFDPGQSVNLEHRRASGGPNARIDAVITMRFYEPRLAS